MARITDLVKTYRLINDPKAPEWNVKFSAALFVIALAAVALAAVAFMPKAGEGPSPPTFAADTAEGDGAPAQTLTEYVGADLATLDPANLPTEDALQARLDAWHAAHPDATVLATEPVTVGGRVVGYTIAYRP